MPTAIGTTETGFEKQLIRVLLAALMLTGLVFAVLEGGSWFNADPAACSLAGNPWVWALLACLAASQGAEWLRQKRADRGTCQWHVLPDRQSRFSKQTRVFRETLILPRCRSEAFHERV